MLLRITFFSIKIIHVELHFISYLEVYVIRRSYAIVL